MGRKAASGIMLVLLTISIVSLATNVKPAKSEWTGTVYIRADGSIDPPDAPIITYDNVTYILTGNITSSANCIVVERDNVIIDGACYTVEGTRDWDSKGIHLLERSNVTIKNINIKNFYYGIYVNCSFTNSLRGNNITNNVIGIELEISSNNIISGNNITNSTFEGIELRDSSDNFISENNITKNSRGIELVNSCSNLILRNNLIDNDYGIYIARSSNSTIISNNNITGNNHGVLIGSSSNNILSENIINNNTFGFGVVGCFLSHFIHSISASNLVNGKPMWYLINQRDLVINPTTYPNVGFLALINSTNVTVEGLTLTNKSQGLLLAYTTNSNITNNNITNNAVGILCSSVVQTSIQRNNITGNEYGLLFNYRSSNNTINGNNIIRNSEGVHLRYSYNNIFYNNNFICNFVQVNVEGNNTWDNGYPSGGNYWSDYNGTDYYSGPYQNETGSDGIGDTRYIIDENNIDHYPLMGPFNSFNASVGCSVDVISNSTIGDFKYFKSNSTIVMHVSNMTANQTAGFCRLTIHHDVMSPPYTVKVNDTRINFQTIYENYTEGISIIYFAYEHSKLEITIIPEFPTAIILPLFMVLNLVAFVFRKKRGMKNQKCGG